MPPNKSLLLIGVIVGAAAFAALRKEPSAEVRLTEQSSPTTESFHPSMNDEGTDDEQLPPGHPPVGDEAPGTTLPPGHPAIGAGDTQAGPSRDDGPPAIRWTVPLKWQTVANASAMRLATYHVPAATGAADEAELTVVRAGGSTEANLKRWVEQFEHPTDEQRAEKRVRGFKISTVEVQGDFKKGAMGSDTATTRSGWMLEGAVVETEEGSYFFKLTGPAASVRAARADFDAMMKSLAPASSESPVPATSTRPALTTPAAM